MVQLAKLFSKLKLVTDNVSFYLCSSQATDNDGLTSLADDPDTSIQVLEKNAQDVSMKVVYSMAWTGSSITWWTVSGGLR